MKRVRKLGLSLIRTWFLVQFEESRRIESQIKLIHEQAFQARIRTGLIQFR